MVDRNRFIDVSKMSPEEVDVLGIQLGARVKAICDDAIAKANAVLNVYGANAKMLIEISELPSELQMIMKPKRKRGRSRKNANLKQEPIS